MGEHDVVERTDEPLTADRIRADLRDLGVDAGETALVHSSLSAMGWVAGGAPTAVDGLLEAVTAAGTVAVPTHSTQLSEPTAWENPSVPDDWVETIRAEAAPYRPAVTPSRGMGAIPECLRTYPDAVRSRHPTTSFSAWGAAAEAVVADHAYDSPMGEESPLARLYERDALIVRIGVDANTSLHLAEYRADLDDPPERSGGRALVDGEPRWVTFEEPTSRDDFRDVEAAFEAADPDRVWRGRVGDAEAVVCRMRPLVDFAVEWMEANR
ncbi:AAC(3) family N-acetyltransferase [Halobaculum sp. CBA1158]|uniref:aminoglycoside N(3)-acetyltransferase n=1 Tax=Halobaculum sp. CBA1158 TaxID=2904243 RepID=UPI001F185D39|nr:AAC(3) family N-acetyltransferase [Halobaculum sp. CBA1158]UIO99179.1 AAC(3) family N-acetyltransferase [Halobaculum sp. CBA1158]